MCDVTIRVEGMHCGSCALNVIKALKALPGVNKAEVSLERSCAIVHYDPDAVDTDAMREAVEEIGFDAPLPQ
ncbi:MAG: heavy-metal-associated domain-containing protein [Azoarcus sp.]|jgi:copper chaperone CopZ|nr:heavy-metal-associated domain-containing protein [Azoarcus sp.]